MTTEERFIQKYNDKMTGDEAYDHLAAETILLEALRHLGYPTLAQLFEDDRKQWWYE